MDITFLSIVSFIILAIVFLSIFLFKSVNKNSFIADDGSVFQNQSDLDVYQNLFEKTKQFFSIDDEKDSSQSILGMDKSFLKILTSDGFQDLKTLVKYRKQIKLLSDLINT
ncbi:hypothetical protein DNJ73_05290 [Prochlorococcus marinus XMU1408]|uniref:Uncharacterized protein n=1 Tax=Prochlorococcus marinus XMU1408 TaxID=2213228 RepID=A0A318R6H8_PROMR|nr:hypothetical protein [Prochlorococcus marinus str. XMU1408]PYE03152.1 hypothetical protein DNJ73_05290 [Prochlorococcus marinus XMU1408]